MTAIKQFSIYLLLLLSIIIDRSTTTTSSSSSSYYPYSISNLSLNVSNRPSSSSFFNRNLYHHQSGSIPYSQIQLCHHNNCHNDGQCMINTNTLKSYCRCQPKYVGTHCEYQNPCFGINRCFNGGTCQPIISSDQPPSFKCLCPLGYSASMCEVETPNICQREHPCRNGGRCILHTDLEHYQCNCQSGWRGELCEERDNCVSNPCKNGAQCISHSNGTGFTCKCASGFRGKTCADDINECTELGNDLACNQKGTCINVPGSYVCNCEAGYTGQHCETVYIPCKTDNPCQNGGDCIADYHSKTYQCNCPSGFTGHDCEVNIDDCGGNLCQNGGTCIDGVNTYTCLCPLNFTGPYCSQDVDECSLQPQPCQNSATCVNTIGGFNCICVNGWTGPTCAENVNDCANAPCFNGATCHDRVGSYFCQCPPGKTGLLCHLDDACASNPCHTGAICDTSPVDGTYVCSCPAGYKGTDCMQDIDECHESGSPCEHGGTCVNTPGSYRCDCAVGFAGARCEININECDSNPCQNEGTCLDERGSYRCACMPGYTGVHCESNIDECQSNPCENNAICTDLINAYRCLCTNGFDGVNCEKSIDQCYKNPCRNNGTCHNVIQIPNQQETVCQCLDGFSGRYCEYNINDCESNPCFHGKCVDMINKFKCICHQGYTGSLCQNRINECLSNPCLNGAKCIDEESGYRCECPNGTYGFRCEFQENECWSNPCLHGGTCHDMRGEYRCECPNGTSGLRCETIIDQCESNPCANGGTCFTTDLQPSGLMYKCRCAQGFYGPRCMSDINECESNPCLNGGQCEDDVNQFRCRCLPGYTGYRCEQSIFNQNHLNQCYCQNGGICVDYHQSSSSSYHQYEWRPPYYCKCKPPYSGFYCEIKNNENFDVEQKHRQAWKRCTKAEFCYEHFSDNICHPECNNRFCLFDGFDCRSENQQSNNDNDNNNNNLNKNKHQQQINNNNNNVCNNSYCESRYYNGHCDPECNTTECAWDGLDCETDRSSSSNNYLKGDLIIDIDFPYNRMNAMNISDIPAPVKKMIRMLSIWIGSVLRLRDIQENNYGINGINGTKLIMSINSKCRNDQCFEDSREVASFLEQSQKRKTSVMEKSEMVMHFGANDELRERSGIDNAKDAQNLTFIVISLLSLLCIGIVLGALVSNNRKKVARGTTWFPEGFFTNQMPISRSGRHHSNNGNASAAAACGDFTRSRGRRESNLLSHSNSVRSGCPDGQEMRQFKSPRDDIMMDEKGQCAAVIYEEPSECRSWSSAHYEAFQPHDSMTPPLPTPSIDSIGPNGMTPLMVASAFPINLMNVDNPDLLCDNNNAVQDLLMNGANVKLTCDKTNETSLHLAARYARADAAKRLIEAGADCNAQDNTGRTPLHTAIAADARGVFEILLRNRTVELNAKTNDGTTPLILAARYANEGMLEQLILHNCDLSVTDDSGKSALHWAASVNNHEAVRVLLQHGADRDARNLRDETPLFLAAREGAYECAKLLLDYNANRDITDNMDQLPRDVALARTHTDIVELLDKHEPSKIPPPIQAINNNNSNNGNNGGSTITSPNRMLVTSPIPTQWSTLGRNTAPRRNNKQHHAVNSPQQQHHQSNINLASGNASIISPTGTLKAAKSSPNNVNDTTLNTNQSNVPPPPPPPRNCVALYNGSLQHPTHHLPNPLPQQPILLLGSGAPSSNHHNQITNYEMLTKSEANDFSTMPQHQQQQTTYPNQTSSSFTMNGAQRHQQQSNQSNNNHDLMMTTGFIAHHQHQASNMSTATAMTNLTSSPTSSSSPYYIHPHHHHQSSQTATISNHQDYNSIPQLMAAQSSAMISPPLIHGQINNDQQSVANGNGTRPPPAYDECFHLKQLSTASLNNHHLNHQQYPSQQQQQQQQQHHHHHKQPIAVAPRQQLLHQHIQQGVNGQQPPTPTATIAPASLLSSPTSNMMAYQNNNHQTVKQPVTTLIQNRSQLQQQQHQQPRPLDSYPTPSPESCASMSTSSPLMNDWTLTTSTTNPSSTATTVINGNNDSTNTNNLLLLNMNVTQPSEQTITTTNTTTAAPTTSATTTTNSTSQTLTSTGQILSSMMMLSPSQQQQQQTNGTINHSSTIFNNNNNNNNNHHHQPRFHQPSSTQQAVFI